MSFSTGFEDGKSPEALVREALQARIDRDELQMPLLPDVALDILSNPLTEASDIQKLSQLIHRDQALATYVLRVSNSAFYSPNGMHVLSLQQAIVRLGTLQLREIATAVAFKSRLFDAPGYEQIMRVLWRQAAASAAYSRNISRVTGHDRELAFLCGLLHDIGKPVLLLAVVDVQGELRRKLADTEVLQIIEDYHVAVGEMIAAELSFAGQIVEAIKYHARCEEAPNFKTEARIVSLACSYAQFALKTGQLPEAQLRFLPPATELGLAPEQVDELLGQSEAIVRFVEGF